MASMAWLADHSSGRICGEQEDALRDLLMDDLKHCGASEAAVREEVDAFLRIGRVSGSNLNRLQRRVRRRAAEGSQSARLETGSVAGGSEFSQGIMSARLPRSANSARPIEIQEGNTDEFATWAEMAKHAKRQEDVENICKREVVRSNQDMIRKHLLQQIDAKKQHKVREQVENQRLFEQQKAELEQYEAAESAKKERRRVKLLEVNKERDAQAAMMADEKFRAETQKKQEDFDLVQKATANLKQEQKEVLEKKNRQRDAMAKLVRECQESRKDHNEVRRQRHEEERLKVREYREMLEMQEERNKQTIPKIREAPTTAPPVAKRRGEEYYSDENIMRQLNEAIKQKDEATLLKEQHQRSARQNNQDFLVQQIEERNRRRREAESKKHEQRVAVQATSDEYVQAEKGRIHQQRMKNIRYRTELEDQILRNRLAKKDQKDAMSNAEKAINRHLLDEAWQLREKLPQT
mmetsp:Transcript_4371/g.11001  ORF Transcript_4371/g.11001 Transcript_4371/m.11001 type:complete len:465 (-) Transcript_4371:42-1436(-)